MLGLTPATHIHLAPGATDMRKGFEGLASLVAEVLGGDPRSGHLFLFCNKGRTRIKVLFWDGSGLWVCSKRLSRGTFRWPAGGGGRGSVVVSQARLMQLIGGLDFTSYSERDWWRG